MIRSEYCEKSNTLYVEMSGLIGIEEMLEYAKSLARYSSLSRCLKVYEEASNSRFDFLIEDINRMLDIMCRNLGVFCSIRHAMVRNTPLETAYSICYQTRNSIENYATKVFSTKQGAMYWLKENLPV